LINVEPVALFLSLHAEALTERLGLLRFGCTAAHPASYFD
jgi:hypothetical protein